MSCEKCNSRLKLNIQPIKVMNVLNRIECTNCNSVYKPTFFTEVVYIYFSTYKFAHICEYKNNYMLFWIFPVYKYIVGPYIMRPLFFRYKELPKKVVDTSNILRI